jgi:hypothetical protein
VAGITYLSRTGVENVQPLEVVIQHAANVRRCLLERAPQAVPASLTRRRICEPLRRTLELARSGSPQLRSSTSVKADSISWRVCLDSSPPREVGHDVGRDEVAGDVEEYGALLGADGDGTVASSGLTWGCSRGCLLVGHGAGGVHALAGPELVGMSRLDVWPAAQARSRRCSGSSCFLHRQVAHRRRSAEHVRRRRTDGFRTDGHSAEARHEQGGRRHRAGQPYRPDRHEQGGRPDRAGQPHRPARHQQGSRRRATAQRELERPALARRDRGRCRSAYAHLRLAAGRQAELRQRL